MICAVVLLINLSAEPWNKADKDNQDHATVRCGEKYPDSPCLKKFIKVEPLMYRAICGEKGNGS